MFESSFASGAILHLGQIQTCVGEPIENSGETIERVVLEGQGVSAVVPLGSYAAKRVAYESSRCSGQRTLNRDKVAIRICVR